MTSAESSELTLLRGSVEAMHSTLTALVGEQQERCKNCVERIERLDLDLNGTNPPQPDVAPGLKEQVRSLNQSRTMARWSLRAVWTVIAAIVGPSACKALAAIFGAGR
jgi:cob(I)alamin adenosyltransferase